MVAVAVALDSILTLMHQLIGCVFTLDSVLTLMHLLIGLGPCPLGALRVCDHSGKNNDACWGWGIHWLGRINDAASYRVGSLSPRSPFGANEKGLKDEGLGFGFHVSAARERRRNMKPKA